MIDIIGDRYLTITSTANEIYMIDFSGTDNTSPKQYVDILNHTSGDMKISSEEIGENNYAIIPAGAAYNSLGIHGSILYIQSSDAGIISIISR